MLYYLYDSSFEGFLTAVHQGLSTGENVVEVIKIKDFQGDLFSTAIQIETKADLAQRLFEELGRLPKEISLTVVYGFLSELAGIETLLFRYLKIVFTQGPLAALNLNNSVVFQTERIRKKVGHEIERLHGFVRFRKLNTGVYYSPIEPDYNVVQFLAPHFTARFADQPWVIHDIKRGNGIFYNSEQCVYLPLVKLDAQLVRLIISGDTLDKQKVMDEMEPKYQLLWNQYFMDIAILERNNKKVQTQRMPKRYWKTMVEKVDG